MAGKTLLQVERQSILALNALHGVVILPPNDADYYVAALAASSIVVGTALTLNGGRRGFGGASSINATIVNATSYTSGDSVTFEIEGLDEYYERAKERITLTNPATTARTVGVFARVDTITPVAKAQLAGATPTISLGIGDDTASPAILFPHPLPGQAFANVLFNTLAAAPVLLAPSASAGQTIDGIPGRYLVLNFAAAAMRAAGYTFLNVTNPAIR